ncbi:GAM-1 [Falcon aviadenovirus A]|nr:GAM-1 [Falcon aviadenovirus A]
MALSPAAKHLPAYWECGLDTEAGTITFSVIVLRDPIFKNYETRYRLLLLNATRSATFSSPDLNKIHSFAVLHCSVTRASKIAIGRTKFIILNCVVRAKSFIGLNNEEKIMYLQALSQQLFHVYPYILKSQRKLVNEYPQMRFASSGFPISNSKSLRLALRTLRVTVSSGKCFSYSPYCANGSRRVIGQLKSFVLDKAERGKTLMQALVSRNEIEKLIPKSVRSIALEGVCYLPLSKYHTKDNKEHWCAHLHPAIENDILDENEDTVAPYRKSPTSLKDFCKLAIIETCFKIRRARYDKKRNSPYFRLKLL